MMLNLNWWELVIVLCILSMVLCLFSYVALMMWAIATFKPTPEELVKAHQPVKRGWKRIVNSRDIAKDHLLDLYIWRLASTQPVYGLLIGLAALLGCSYLMLMIATLGAAMGVVELPATPHLNAVGR